MANQPNSIKKTIRFFTGWSLASSGARLAGLVTFTVAVDQLLERFNVDLVQATGTSLFLTGSLILNVAFAIEAYVLWTHLHRHMNAEIEKHDPRLAFANAALTFADYLKGQQKNTSLLTLRSNLSRLFHLMGLHEHRVKLGEIALYSATQLNDTLSKAEVFLDDLGWARFLRGDKVGSESNIRRAIEILDSYVPDSPQHRVEKALLSAKANRHLAMLTGDPSTAVRFLEVAKGCLEALKADDATKNIQVEDVARDQAQLLHAQSSVIAKRLGIERVGRIAANDTTAVADLTAATAQVRDAERIFESIGDLERQTKALVLLHRLYSAIGDDARALEIAVKRDYLSQISGIDRGAESAVRLREFERG